jgi:hypothetical protein
MKFSTQIKQAISFSLIATMSLAFCYSIAEPSLSEATTASDSVNISLTVTSGLSITSPADSSMSSALGFSQNTAVGTTTWNVKTNSSTGYTLAVRATSSPAMQSSTDTINDYTTSTTTTWSVTNAAAFGYSVIGTDSPTATWGNGGSSCSGSSANVIPTSLKYKGFTTSDVQTSTRSSTTTTSGVDTTICYAVEQNNVYIPSGSYAATVIATATAS